MTDKTCSASSPTNIHFFVATLDPSQSPSVDDYFHWQRLETLGILAGGISHDFNNLIATIQGNAELALRRLQKDDPVCHLLDNIMMATRTAGGLSEQILAFSRQEMLKHERLDLNQVLSDSARLLDVAIPRSVEYVLALLEEPLYVEANSSQLAQVLLNLGVNAIQAIGEESGKIVFSISEESAGFAKIEVTDTGKGISATEMPRIFDPFFTTNPQHTGTGLGLVMVKRIVEQYGGSIQVESEPNEGTTFFIRWPLLK